MELYAGEFSAQLNEHVFGKTSKEPKEAKSERNKLTYILQRQLNNFLLIHVIFLLILRKIN